ncbi:hypothetical protein TRAPUB_4371 [Trametes pubescens]|uniref:Uncharacterized protein n=1 Tax=Trametes pubescens TaxID=154538 RepID=A0A1M2VBI0_TRAPU|nr:hypothetical protein TRAPUB_4371 [Trametes pubescens]
MTGREVWPSLPDRMDLKDKCGRAYAEEHGMESRNEFELWYKEKSHYYKKKLSVLDPAAASVKLATTEPAKSGMSSAEQASVEQ